MILHRRHDDRVEKSRGQRGRWARSGAAAALLLLAAGCGPSTAEPAKPAYPQLKGEVVSVDVARKVAVVHHGAIEGVMPAMTMEFAISAGDAAVLKPGEHIRAEVVPNDKGDWGLEKIWPDDTTAQATVDAQANALRQDTLIRGRGAYREIGEAMPDFALYDQTGAVVQSTRFRGKQIMMNFIYTRCPVANMCPASTAKMIQTQRLAREAGVKDLELISITLDPDYDTPGVLKEYADTRGIDTSNFSLLTGPENAIKDLLTQFGIIAEFKGNFLNHTLATLLIDANGRIVHRADGTVWDPKDFVAAMKR